jgi:glycosyltransferase involved in cell wall biosynthesis
MMRGFLWYVKKHIDKIQQVLVYTKEGKQWWEKQMPELPVHIMAAPVDTEAFNVAQEKDWLPSGVLRVLMNARYSTYKRHKDLLQAAADLLSKGKQLHITLIGRADSGRQRVEQLVKEYGLEDVVTFLDPLPMEEMPGLYHTHDVLVLPSYNEAIGMVVPEAMACGIPTITSDTVGANVYVKAGETGWVYPTGDIEALKVTLNECFNVSELKRRSAAARVMAEVHFSVPIIAQRLLAVLKELPEKNLD